MRVFSRIARKQQSGWRFQFNCLRATPATVKFRISGSEIGFPCDESGDGANNKDSHHADRFFTIEG